MQSFIRQKLLTCVFYLLDPAIEHTVQSLIVAPPCGASAQLLP